jgi:ABC-type glycerol-3-phosphate transport system substrate-binding protein
MREASPTSRIGSTLRLLVGLLLVVPALGLLALGPRTSRPVPADRVVVTYWEKWTDFEGEAMRRLVDVFNNTEGAQRGIYVDYVVTTQIDLKTLVATSGGDPPDLAGLWPHNISSFASKGALQPLGARAAAAGIDGRQILPVYYDPCHYHGELYALPLTPWSLALYYNKGLFREFAGALADAGYDAERPPRTLDELLGYCRVLQRRDAGGQLDLLGFLPSKPEAIGWYYHTWGLWCGGTFADPRDGRARVDAPPFVRGYTWVQDYLHTFGLQDVLRFESSLANFNSPDNPFMIGKLAMMQQGPWFANMIRQYAPQLDYGVAPFPTADGSEISYCGQDVLVIPTGARHPDQAWAFVEWLYRSPPIHVSSGHAQPEPGFEYYVARTPAGPERRPMPRLRPIEWICWAHYKNSPLVAPSEEFTATHPNPGIAVHDRLARSPLARTEPPLPNWTELLAEFAAAYRDIWGGRAAAEERLRAAQERIDALQQLAARGLARYGEPYP